MRRIAAELRISRHLAGRIGERSPAGPGGRDASSRSAEAARVAWQHPGRASFRSSGIFWPAGPRSRPCGSTRSCVPEVLRAATRSSRTWSAGFGPSRDRVPVLRFETGKGQQAQMDYAVYEIDFTEEGRRRVNLFSYVLGYSRRQYLRFVAVAGLRDHDPRARAGLRAPRRRGRHLSVRQHEGRGGPLRRRRTDLQHPLPGVRHALRLQGMGLSAPPAPNERQGREALPTMSKTNFLNGRSFRSWSISTK